MVSLDINDFQIDDYSKPMNLLMLLEMAVHSSLHYASGPIIDPCFSRVAAHIFNCYTGHGYRMLGLDSLLVAPATKIVD